MNIQTYRTPRGAKNYESELMTMYPDAVTYVRNLGFRDWAVNVTINGVSGWAGKRPKNFGKKADDAACARQLCNLQQTEK